MKRGERHSGPRDDSTSGNAPRDGANTAPAGNARCGTRALCCGRASPISKLLPPAMPALGKAYSVENAMATRSKRRGRRYSRIRDVADVIEDLAVVKMSRERTQLKRQLVL